MDKKKNKTLYAKSRLLNVKKSIISLKITRFIVQFFFFFLFFSSFLGIGPWAILIPVNGLLGVPTKTVGEAFGSFQYMLYLLIPPLLPLASILIAAIIVNRAFCAWACPFGLIQDMLTFVKKRHAKISMRTHGQMIYVKYVVLAATLLMSGTLAIYSNLGINRSYIDSLGPFAMAPFNTLSPADTLLAVVPRTVLDTGYVLTETIQRPGTDVSGTIISSLTSVSLLFWARIIILVLTLALVVYVQRGWCRYVCPQGAFSSIFSRFSFLGLRREPVRCQKVGCHDCVEACPTKVPILDQPWEKFTHPECIMCLECIGACSTKAIRLKFP